MFENAQIPIPCSKCGRQTKKSVGWLKSNTSFACGCGTRIDVNASHFNRSMKQVDKAVDDFKRSLKRFGR